MHDDDPGPKHDMKRDMVSHYAPRNTAAYVLIFYEVPWAYDPTLRVPVSTVVSLN